MVDNCSFSDSLDLVTKFLISSHCFTNFFSCSGVIEETSGLGKGVGFPKMLPSHSTGKGSLTKIELFSWDIRKDTQ